MLEILGNGPLPQIKDYHKNPKFNIQFLEGLRICLKQIAMRDSTKGKAQTHFDPEELLKGQDLKIALALAWRIICNYSIQEYDPVYGASSKECMFFSTTTNIYLYSYHPPCFLFFLFCN